eukprot:scaffold26988_cov197-Isochrysis_galbana.AAC.2
MGGRRGGRKHRAVLPPEGARTSAGLAAQAGGLDRWGNEAAVTGAPAASRTAWGDRASRATRASSAPTTSGGGGCPASAPFRFPCTCRRRRRPPPMRCPAPQPLGKPGRCGHPWAGDRCRHRRRSHRPHTPRSGCQPARPVAWLRKGGRQPWGRRVR